MFGTPNWKLTAGSPKNHPLLKREIIWTKSPWNGFHVNFPGYIHLGFPGCNQPTLNPTRFFSYAIAGRLPSISNATLWQLSRGWVWLVGWFVLLLSLMCDSSLFGRAHPFFGWGDLGFVSTVNLWWMQLCGHQLMDTSWFSSGWAW